MDICLSNNNASEEATASLEHGSNHLSVNGIHRRSHRSSDASSDRSLGMAIGRDEDELHSTYGANTDGEDLESDPLVPRVGMDFDSEAAVYNFYSSYAKQTGFNVRRGKAEYSGSDKGVVRAKSFLCSCGGLKSKEQIANAMRYKRRDTRTGCDAKIECVVNDGTWKISEVVLEHNHVTTALSTGRIAYNVRAVGERALDSDADLTWEDRPRPAPEETQDLIDHFRRLARLDCCSCYSLRVVEARGMENFFWRDSRSKVEYEHFSDLLVLDTRTWISKYGMIFAMFWGLNHHRKPTIFGHGLLVDRTVNSDVKDGFPILVLNGDKRLTLLPPLPPQKESPVPSPLTHPKRPPFSLFGALSLTLSASLLASVLVAVIDFPAAAPEIASCRLASRPSLSSTPYSVPISDSNT